MGYVSIPNTFVNLTTADATDVNANFTALGNGISDGASDINVSSGTFGKSVSVAGSLQAASCSTLTGTLTVAGYASVGGSLTVLGSENITGSLTVSGSARVTNSLTVSGTATALGAVSVGGSLSVAGACTVSSTMIVSGNALIAGSMTVATTLTVGTISGTVQAAGIAKAWARMAANGNLTAATGITDATRTAGGQYIIYFESARNSANYVVLTTDEGTYAKGAWTWVADAATSSCHIYHRDENDNYADVKNSMYIVVFDT